MTLLKIAIISQQIVRIIWAYIIVEIFAICQRKYHRIALFHFCFLFSFIYIYIFVFVNWDCCWLISQFCDIYSHCKCNPLSALCECQTNAMQDTRYKKPIHTRYICQARDIKDIYVNCHDLPDQLVHSANKQMKIDVSVCPSPSFCLSLCLSRCLHYLFYFTFDVRPLHKWKINKFLNDNTLHGICCCCCWGRTESASKLKLMLIGAHEFKRTAVRRGERAIP